MKTRQILPPTYLLIALLIILVLHFVFPGMKLIHLPWNLFGLIPLIIGIALNLFADNALHRAGTTVKPFQESTTLLTDGVYRISRHPMYLGFILILIGVVVLLGSLMPWVIIPIFAVLMEVVFIRVEEHMLEEKFGAGWLVYKKKVRRWI
jgi:protein-S-isoprenylcysteine O-methyltransferase Ste14